MIAEGGIPKPSFNAFRLLHLLGNERLALDSNSALVTRTKDGSLAIAVWNYSALLKEQEPAGADNIETEQSFSVLITPWCIVSDGDHGNALVSYNAKGSPSDPTQKQIQELRKAAAISPAEVFKLNSNQITLHFHRRRSI